MAVLIVDDDKNIIAALQLLLKSEGLESLACQSPKDALAAVHRQPFDLALVDLNYHEDTTSGKEGLELIPQLREIDGDLPIIAMTGWGTISVAVTAMQRGAIDFVEKPWDDNNRLLNSIRTQMQLRKSRQREKKLSAENALLHQQLRGQNSGADAVISRSQTMNSVLSMARRIAASDIPVLITGENGTGKSLLAQYIHTHSTCAQGPFIAVNMGGIAETTFESEMFGHVKGAFTDAKTERIGRIELAEGGTLFMDEIANMPLNQQAKILRLLEEHQFEKLGSSQTLQSHVRIISATNADLDSLIAERGFRQDLLYRLNGITLTIPPLRERVEDIEALARNFLAHAVQHYGCTATTFAPSTMDCLRNYHWPGNVRELQHVIERAVLLAQQEEILERDLQLVSANNVAAGNGAIPDDLTLEQAEQWYIQRVLEKNDGNATSAAKALGISRSALYRRLGKTE